MKNGTKISLIVASILLIAGLVLSFTILAVVDPKALEWNTEEFEVKTEIIDVPFSDIRILTTDADIRLMPATDGVCRVEHPESKYTGYDIVTKDGLLAIEYRDTRKWYQFKIDFYVPNREVLVYLPQSQYDAVMLHTASGDIAVDLGAEYRTAKLSTASGDVAWHAKVTQSCDITTASGDILLHDVNSDGSIRLRSTSGKCTVTNLKCEDFDAKTTSGDMVLANITAQKLTGVSTSGELLLSGCLGLEMLLENTSGDIELSNCDGNDITMTTVSGDIEGTLVSAKIFESHTTSGDISLPRSEAVNSRCSVKTVSGDVEIDIA